MSHFTAKSLTLYGTAIASVLVLFKGVTAYGEANLKAPPPIDGRYQLLTKGLPGCENPSPIFLNLQQSGIYLNGHLATAKNNESPEGNAEKQSSLIGRFNQKQVILSGTVYLPALCGKSGEEVASTQRQSATIQGKIEGETFAGQIRLSSGKEAIAFTAKREAPEKQQEKH